MLATAPYIQLDSLTVDTGLELLEEESRRIDRLPIHAHHHIAPAQLRVIRRAALAHSVDQRAVDTFGQVHGGPKLGVEVLEVQPQPDRRDLSVLDQFVDYALGDIDRDRKADPLSAAVHRGVDSDQFTGRIDERSAGITRVDRCIGLQESVIHAVLGSDRPVDRGDDTCGHCARQTEWVADRDDRLADHQVGRCRRRNPRELAIGFDLENRDVVVRVCADHLRLVLAAIGQADDDPAGAADDVFVGEDVAFRVDQYARPETLGGFGNAPFEVIAKERIEERIAAALKRVAASDDALGGDADDAGADTLHDLDRGRAPQKRVARGRDRRDRAHRQRDGEEFLHVGCQTRRPDRIFEPKVARNAIMLLSPPAVTRDLERDLAVRVSVALRHPGSLADRRGSLDRCTEARIRAPVRRAPEFAARAPGRVNLIGEHTDYNEGLVLPLAIDRDTLSIAALRSDRRFRIYSTELRELLEFDAAEFAPTGSWGDYARGVVRAFVEAGHRLPGLDIAIASEVPLESGLSSSAALCVSLATVFDASGGLGLLPIDRARLAHRAESEFVGVGCGIMDQFASALGGAGTAIRIDCRSQQVEPVPVPEELCMLVASSGVRRSLVQAGYRERVAECRSAIALAVEHGIAPSDATALRDLGAASLPQLESVLPPTLYRRARHVITENGRVDAACAALRIGDLSAVGAILKEGMRSLRGDFEVSTPQLDRLCEVADADPDVFGSRLTGAGFGGCTIHLLRPSALSRLTRVLEPHARNLYPLHPASPAAAMVCR